MLDVNNRSPISRDDVGVAIRKLREAGAAVREMRDRFCLDSAGRDAADMYESLNKSDDMIFDAESVLLSVLAKLPQS